MRYLITGAAGFIGSHFTRELVSGRFGAAASVTVLDRLTYAGNEENLDDIRADITFIKGDICDRALLDRIVPGHDVVVNFAAESHVDRSITSPHDFIMTNVVGVQVLFDACLAHGVSRIVHVGTDEVYGSIEDGSWSEASPLQPNSPYAASKAAAELLVRAYFCTYGLPVMSTRCSNTYGSHQFPEKAIPLFITNLLDGHPIPLYGDGRHVRDWIHVLDHCRAIAVVLEQGIPGRSYNISGGFELSNRELVTMILDAFNATWADVTEVPDRAGHDLRYSVDDSAIRQLGFAPHIPMSSGLPETIQWYAGNRAWWLPLKEHR